MELELSLIFFNALVLGLSTVNCFSSIMTVSETSDASGITWAHAVNSISELDKELLGPVHFLEADVSMGYVISAPSRNLSVQMPIMAHPPATISDISLETWLDTVIKHKTGKGIKLDFKSIESVEPSLLSLQERNKKLDFPLWLNADILLGPVDSSAKPVSPEHFLNLCHQYFPTAVLSIGWTTYLLPAMPIKSWKYQWAHVRQMADLIRCHGYKPHSKYTFPVRALFACRSIKQLQWLLRIVPDSSLTVWSASIDPIEVNDLLRIRASFPVSKVYYDVPEPTNGVFQERKQEITPVEYPVSNDDRWITVTRGQSEPCESFTYVSNDTILFGKSVKSAVLLKNLLLVGSNHNLKVRGRVEFLNTFGPNPTFVANQELVIVLADVKLFSKNTTADGYDFDLTESDSDVIWSALDASFLHKFEQKLSDKKSACRIFSLDTTSERPFQAWTVSCDALTENVPFEKLIESGVPEVSNKKRLVLPDGPFMLGFFSTGEDHVVVYDLTVMGKNEGIASKSSFVSKPNWLMSTCLGIISFVIVTMLIL